jgi:hypothetical protein
VEFKPIGNPANNTALGWAQDILIVVQKLRLIVASLIGSITVVREGEGGGFCGIYYVSPDDLLDDLAMLQTLEGHEYSVSAVAVDSTP